MSTQLVLAILTAWLALAVAGGLLIGATIRWADQQAGQR